MQRNFDRHRRVRQAGFTLIELLMVIVIIAVLVSLLTVAVASAMQNARVASVRAELSSIAGAIAAFESTFGRQPPSYMVLHESAAAWNAGDVQTRRDRARIRALWPQFDFARDRDLNADGDTTDTHVLTGAECLVFFLGGVVGPDGVPIGFSKNPADPFDAGSSRLGPFLETVERPDRLVDVDGDGFPELLDPLPNQTAPIIYASSYDGTGYNRHASGHYVDVIVYTNDVANPTPLDMSSVYFHPSGDAPLNAKSYQLISPGFDGEYGVGGSYDPDGSYSWNSQRAVEADNIIR